MLTQAVRKLSFLTMRMKARLTIGAAVDEAMAVVRLDEVQVEVLMVEVQHRSRHTLPAS